MIRKKVKWKKLCENFIPKTMIWGNEQKKHDIFYHAQMCSFRSSSAVVVEDYYAKRKDINFGLNAILIIA